MARKWMDAADVAKLIRKALKVFPGVKFSVRTSKYAGGASVDVSWTDGPTIARVEEVAGHFHGATFDGMVDLQTSHTSFLDGEPVRYGNDYIFFNRETSYDLMRECQFNVARWWGGETGDQIRAVEIMEYRAGEGSINTDSIDLQRLILGEVSKTQGYPLPLSMDFEPQVIAQEGA